MGKERQQYLSRTDVQIYLRKYPDVTAAEKRDLLQWLKSGHSQATNDCDLTDDRGCPLDFLDARRTVLDLMQQHMQHLDKPEKAPPDPAKDSFDLPF